MAKPSSIQEWLDSKERDYDTGVKLYAAHPTALRALVQNMQRKQTAQMEEKLVYVMEKAAAADQEGSTEILKKKEKGKASNPTPKVSKKAAPAEPVPPMGEQATPPAEGLLPLGPPNEEEE